MPCTDWDTEERKRAERTDQVNKLTRLLCEAMGYLEDRNLGDGSKELKQWYADHKEMDRRRIEAERSKVEKKILKRKALAKLTSEERRALGLD